MNPRIMVAIADMLDKIPGQVFDELSEEERKINKINVKATSECIEGFISWWREFPAGGWYSSGRPDLEKSDRVWNFILEKKLMPVYSTEDTLIYRVHNRMPKPKLVDYSYDEGSRRYEKDLHIWEKQDDPKYIDWHNHWVSFTNDPKVISSDYFKHKQMRGLVMVLRAKNAIDISYLANQGVFPENEVVARMDNRQLVEVLTFKQFIAKYAE